MTAKQAYEVFFEPTDKEITAEYLKKNISESELKKIYRNLMMMYHPDTPKNSKRDEAEAVIISQEINNAYSILRYLLGVPGVTYPPGKYEVLLYTKRQKEDIIAFSRVRNDYKDKTNQVINIYFYEIISAIYERAKGDKNKIRDDMSISELAEIASAFEEFSDKQLAILDEKQKEYQRVLELMDKAKNEKELTDILKDFAASYYSRLEDKDYLDKIKNWRDQGTTSILFRINELTSDILSVKKKITDSLTLARDIYIEKQQYHKWLKINGALNRIRKVKADYERLHILAETMTEVTEINGQIRDCQFKWQKGIKYVDEIDIKNLTSDEIKYIESLIRSLVTSDYISLLENPEEYRIFKNTYDGLAMGSKEQDKILEGTFIECKKETIRKLIYNQNLVRELQAQLGEEESDKKIIREEFSKMPLREVERISKKINRELGYYQKKAIGVYYDYLVNYFSSKREMDSLLMCSEIYDISTKERNDDETVNSCFKKLRTLYQAHNGTSSLGNGTKNLSKQLLINEIQDVYQKVYPVGELTPYDIEEKYDARYKMNIISLANLYRQLVYSVKPDDRDKDNPQFRPR